MTKNDCGWQGYGFAAPYEDAACCSGQIGDLDDCDAPGGPIGLRDEVCPQCHGDGEGNHDKVGPMALIRQRALDECLELCEQIEDEDLREMIIDHFKGWHGLVTKLEA